MAKTDKGKWKKRVGTALKGSETAVGVIGAFPGSGLLSEGL